MTSLPDFLLARIADEQAEAEAAIVVLKAANESVEWWVDGPGEKSGKFWIYDTGEKFTHEAIAAHIARHDPARVLADCAARRAIVEFAVDNTGAAKAQRATGVGDYFIAAAETASTILRVMAQPYADHPEFDQAWAL